MARSDNETRAKSGNGREGGHGRSWLVMVPIVAFVGLAILFAFSLGSADPTRLPSALIGKPVPNHEFEELDTGSDGPAIKRKFGAEDLATGEVTVVNFWASWCGPCVAEHPMLMELKKRGVRLAGVNYKDPPPGGRRFLGRYGNPFELLGVDPAGRGAIEWGVYGMPETFVVDGEGRIVYKHIGPITAASLTDKVLPAIERAGSE